MIDHTALDRLVGSHVAERFHVAMEEASDGADGPSLVAMAVEQAAASGQSVDETMTVLLDNLAVWRESE